MWLQQRLKGLPGLLSSSWARRLLALLVFLLAASWYLGGAWPRLLLRLRPGGASGGAAGLCLQAETRAWRKGGEARLLGEGPGQGPPGLVGNGHLLLDAQANRLWVAPMGAPGPAWPTDYSPFAQLRGPAGAESEAWASALLPKEGALRRVRCVQPGGPGGACVTIREELLAHRGLPHLYLQRLVVDNPTDRLVALEVTGPGSSSSSSSSSGRAFATSLEKTSDRQFFLSSGRALQPAGEKLVLVVVAAKKLVSRVQVAPKSRFEETLLSVVLSSEPIEAAQLDETFGRLREAAKRELMEVLPLRTEELIQEHRRAWDELFISATPST
ncbi:hypothetical protein E2320_006142 [Naja naja]|nr:hypothetical protein E2320_006142 [Naja naja]